MNIKKICESIKRRKVIRNGKIVRKWTTNRIGYKIKIDPRTRKGKEVRMSSEEIRNRLVASRRRVGKMKSMKSRIIRKRNLSMLKRQGWKSQGWKG